MYFGMQWIKMKTNKFMTMKHLKERGQKYYFDNFISFTIL
jgi:hypothetical protein